MQLNVINGSLGTCLFNSKFILSYLGFRLLRKISFEFLFLQESSFFFLENWAQKKINPPTIFFIYLRNKKSSMLQSHSHSQNHTKRPTHNHTQKWLMENDFTKKYWHINSPSLRTSFKHAQRLFLLLLLRFHLFGLFNSASDMSYTVWWVSFFS